MKAMKEPPRGTVVVCRRKINGDWLGAKNTDVGWRITVGGYAAIRWVDLLSMTDIVAVYLPDAKSGTDADSLRVGTIPRGGRPGQFLVKMSDDDFDTAWADPPYVLAPVPGPYGPLRITNTSENARAWLAQEADEAETVAEQQDRAERLRRAADRLDGTEDGYWPADITIRFATTGGDSREIDASGLASLLRAVALLAGTAEGKGEFGTPYAVCIECDSHDGHDDHCVVGAAEVLADAVLGEVKA